MEHGAFIFIPQQNWILTILIRKLFILLQIMNQLQRTDSAFHYIPAIVQLSHHTFLLLEHPLA